MKIAMLREFVKDGDNVQRPVAKQPNLDHKEETKYSEPVAASLTGQQKEIEPSNVVPMQSSQGNVDDTWDYGLDPIEDEETIKTIRRYKTTFPALYHKITNFN